MNEGAKTCKFCLEDIAPEENSYYSQQAGMKGDYHWSCFVLACRKVNRIGAQQIGSNSINDDLAEDYSKSAIDS